MGRSSGLIWAVGGGLIGLAGLIVGLVVALRPSPDASTPPVRIDDPNTLIDVAWEFVSEGRADRLPELIHAESPEMESVLARLGRLLGAVQELAAEVQTRFPEDVRQVKAAQAAGGGLFKQARAAANNGPDDSFVARVFADPYGWLETARGRVSVAYVSDDLRALMVDGAPAMGFGITLREYDDGWRIVPPTTLPMVQRYLPQSREEWQIVASMVTVLENAIRDLAADVKSGRARSLNDTARLAGEKAWMPLMMTIVAYQKAMEARSR